MVNVAFLVVSTSILVAMKAKGLFSNFQEKLNDDSLFKKAKFTLLLIILCLGLIWVFITQFVPGSDQLDVMSSAYSIRVVIILFLLQVAILTDGIINWDLLLLNIYLAECLGITM